MNAFLKHPQRTVLGVIAFCWAVLVILYLPSLGGSGFLIDDESLIHIPQLQAPLSWALLKTFFTPGGHVDFYPVRDLFYWIEIHLLKADPQCLDMTVFRLASVTLFGGVLFFAARLFRSIYGGLSDFGSISWILILGFLPFHSEMLMWASAQKDLLAIFFGLVSVDLFFRWKRRGYVDVIPALFSQFFLILSLLSKTSLVLLPWVGLLFVMREPDRLASRKARGLALCAIASVFSTAWALLQSHVYVSINDMRLRYPMPYRIEASAAALGREVLGIFWPAFNTVDVENWGSWLHHNQAFVWAGFAFWALSFIGLVVSGRGREKYFWGLIAAGALYLPTSGLLFEHRNFYSVRYFEPILICLWLTIPAAVDSIRWPKVAMKGVAAAAIVFCLLFTYRDSKVWASSVVVFEKSLNHSPGNLALQAQFASALREEKRWGRLSIERKKILDGLDARIQRECGLSDSAAPAGDDCLSTWARIFLNPVPREASQFMAASRHLQSALERLLPERVPRFLARRAILEIDAGQTWHEPVAQLAEESGFENSPEGRVRILAALCLSGHVLEASERKTRYFSSLWLNDPTLRVFGAEIMAGLPLDQSRRLARCLF